jgi:predicted Zn-dependent protease with MMP-like domain
VGLFDSTPLTERSVDDTGDLPDVIYIIRRPHLGL